MAQLYVGDVLSLGAIVISWSGAIQPLAALLATFVAIVWYGIQVYESATVQKHLRAHRIHHRRRKRHKANHDAPEHVHHV